MYERFPDQPNNQKAVQYLLGDGHYARVILEVQQRKSDRVEVEAQAFQIDADGAFIAAPSGAASRTSGTTHVISTSGVATGTHVLKPGWVRVVGDYNFETVPEDVPRVSAKPSEPGEIDARAFDEVAGILYRFDMGELERIRQGKCEELKAIINQSSALAELDI
jgi:hypothetical protein